MTFPAWLRALDHRDFRLFWTGQMISLIGTWMQSLGQSWLVLEMTGSPFKLGLVSALQFAPTLFFSVPAGALTDRLPKRRLVLTTQSVLLVQALTLAILVWSGHVRYWHVAVLAVVFGLANTADMPARQSFVVEMVGKDDLMNAIALNSAVFNAARVVGPAVAGVIVGQYGTSIAFLLNAASFVAVIAALLMIRAEGRAARRSASLMEDIVEGLAFAVRTPRITFVLTLVSAVSIFVINYNVLVPLLARDVLHQDAHGFGFLMAMLGAGALIGALALAALGGARPRLSLIVGAALTVSAGALVMSMVRQFWLASVVLFVMGGAGILFMASCNTTLQMSAPDALRGRVMSLYAMLFAGLTPIGSFLMGSLAEGVGVPPAFLVGGALGFLSVLGVTLWFRVRRRAGPG